MDDVYFKLLDDVEKRKTFYRHINVKKELPVEKQLSNAISDITTKTVKPGFFTMVISIPGKMEAVYRIKKFKNGYIVLNFYNGTWTEVLRADKMDELRSNLKEKIYDAIQ